MEHAEPSTTKPHAQNTLSLPSPEILREIARKQEERAKAIRERRAREELPAPEDGGGKGGEGERRANAAKMIQRNYRGHRERRALEGYGLSPSTRWLEV